MKRIFAAIFALILAVGTPIFAKEDGDAATETVITAERMRVDYGKEVTHFEGNVLVVDPKMTVRADKLTAYFSREQRGVKRIECEGDVVITQGEQRAFGERAAYDVAEGRMTLTGNPRIESKDGAVSGEMVIVYPNENRMTVEGRARLTIPSAGSSEKLFPSREEK
jgi:lipopolysaccharide export system protein LptA